MLVNKTISCLFFICLSFPFLSINLIAFSQNIQAIDNQKLNLDLHNVDLLIQKAENTIILGDHQKSVHIMNEASALLLDNSKYFSSQISNRLYNLANLYISIGDTNNAFSLLEKSLQIDEHIYGSESLELIYSLNRLSLILISEGRYMEADNYLHHAIRIQTNNNSKNSSNFVESKILLAWNYYYKEEIILAQKEVDEALQIILSIPHDDSELKELKMIATLLEIFLNIQLGDINKNENEEFILSLENDLNLDARASITEASLYLVIGIYYNLQKKYEKAEKFINEFLSFTEVNNYLDNRFLGTGLITLSSIYIETNRINDAKKILKEILEYQDTKNEIRILALTMMAEIYLREEKTLDAKNLYMELLERLERIDSGFIPFPESVRSIIEYRLGLALISQQDYRSAYGFIKQSYFRDRNNIANVLHFLAEDHKTKYLSNYETNSDIALSLSLNYLKDDRGAHELALLNILDRKGIILDDLSESNKLIREYIDVQSKNLLEQYNSVNNQIEFFAFQELNPSFNRDFMQKQRQNLLEEKIHIENLLTKLSAEHRKTRHSNSIDTIISYLENNMSLIEFRLYSPYSKDSSNDLWGELRYAAFILNSDGSIHSKDLGTVQEIDIAINQFKNVLQSESERGAGVLFEDDQDKLKTLYQKILQPIYPYIQNSEHLLISPDGNLNLIPFEALQKEDDKYLIQTHKITYLSSGRDLRSLNNNERPAPQPPLILANPSFNQGSSIQIVANPNRIIDLSQPVTQLPFTEKEGIAIKKLLPDSLLFSEGSATEAQIKSIENPRVLHLATHGFFQENLNPDANQLDNPLLRSGLVLAGFNDQRGNDPSSTILTAQEITGLDFRGTDLVTLSACATGLGDVVSGEGVFGLRRAFTIAGARSQVMSLWNVNDESTKDLMVNFYTRLNQGEARVDALRNAQLQMLKGEMGDEYRHPYYWAPFISTGDWRPMPKR